VFQEFELLEYLDVLDNVLLPYRLTSLLELDPSVRARAGDLLVDLGLGDKLGRYPMQLSQGERQRVAIARALLTSPCLLLMDEPFGALDALTREQLYGDIQEIWRQRRKTIIFVTHNVREAACLGDQVVLFSPHPGRIQERFEIDLPRPRDINSVDLAKHASAIMRALKHHLRPEMAEVAE